MIIYVDIDGTLADVKVRYKKAGKEPKSRGKCWSNWLRRVQNSKTLAQDSPVPGMVNFVWLFFPTHGSDEIVYLTGRSESYRKVTEDWLHTIGFPISVRLIMRPKGNRQLNGVLKEALVKKDIAGSKYIDIMIIDDDPHGDIKKACDRNGWTMLKAVSGS